MGNGIKNENIAIKYCIKIKQAKHDKKAPE